MLTRNQLSVFLNAFLDQFGEHIIAAEYDSRGKLVILTNPYLDFNTLVLHIAENVIKIFKYTAHLEIILYAFGSNDDAQIQIN